MLRKSTFTTAAMLSGVAGVLALAGTGGSVATSGSQTLPGDGVVRVESAYGFEDTVTRLKADVESKGIMWFGVIEQSKLAAAAGIALDPSTLVVFGNPGLGNRFLTSNPSAGIDWPVRLLVTRDGAGKVWAHYTDFRWIADRHRIRDRDAEFRKAAEVIGSITASVARK